MAYNDANIQKNNNSKTKFPPPPSRNNTTVTSNDFIFKNCVYENRVLMNKSTGRKISAVIPVHIFGNPVDIEKIIEISKITHDEELEKILQKYPLEEGYDITVVPIDATREKIIIKKVQKEEKASLTK